MKHFDISGDAPRGSSAETLGASVDLEGEADSTPVALDGPETHDEQAEHAGANTGHADFGTGDASEAGGDDGEALDEPATPIEVAPVQSGFAALGLSEPILRAVEELGYVTPTPVQVAAIPLVLMGRDVLGTAQTGTGKTAGFTLPMLDILSGSRARARMPRSLILEPTRELALQVAENFVKYGKYLKLTHALIIGGESMSDQRDVLMRGVDVLIATPGRLIDTFERGGLLLTDTRVLVIDEADRMLDMGFIPDVERIVAMLPANRQTLFFSATMAPEIRRLADVFLQNPKEVTVSRAASVATTIIAGLALVAEDEKREALRRLIKSEEVQNALIFCNRKRDVDTLFKSLMKHGFSVGALHGDMAQPVRFATLEKFKNGELRLLCCSDVAARGLDIGGLSHVFNFDVPIHAEDYVHRIGRTGRAGREGHAFTIASPQERFAVEAIEKLTGAPIPRMQIPGLDVVTWAADADRKRRGRRGSSTHDDKPAKTTRPPRGKSERPVPVAEKQAPIEEAPFIRVPESRPIVSDEPARTVAPERPEPGSRERAPVRDRGRIGERSPDRYSDRDRTRERRHRDDDLGPAVMGFGDKTPAFMLVAARASREQAFELSAASTEAER